jgi:hypothetical protein
MKALIFALFLMTGSAFAADAPTVTPAEQAKIYLGSAYSLAMGLPSKIDNLQYYACRDAEVLDLIIKALSAPEVLTAAYEVDPWTTRNIGISQDQIVAFLALCKDDGITESEKPEALKLATRISDNMGLE